MRFPGFYRECAIQGSNSVPLVDNQELAKQDSQGASQSPFSALDPDLQTVIAAWDKLPTALKSAVLAIVSSNREAKGYRSKPTDECRRRSVLQDSFGQSSRAPGFVDFVTGVARTAVLTSLVPIRTVCVVVHLLRSLALLFTVC